jgi:hypothetical protein
MMIMRVLATKKGGENWVISPKRRSQPHVGAPNMQPLIWVNNHHRLVLVALVLRQIYEHSVNIAGLTILKVTK